MITHDISLRETAFSAVESVDSLWDTTPTTPTFDDIVVARAAETLGAAGVPNAVALWIAEAALNDKAHDIKQALKDELDIKWGDDS